MDSDKRRSSRPESHQRSGDPSRGQSHSRRESPASRKGRRSTDTRDPRTELSEEFHNSLRIFRPPPHQAREEVTRRVKQDRLEQWRKETAPRYYEEPTHLRQPEARSAWQASDPSSSVTSPRSRRARSGERRQFQFLSAPLQERHGSEDSTILETSRINERTDLLRIAAKNAATNPVQLSAMTFNLPSASEVGWPRKPAKDPGRAEVIYLNKRGGGYESQTVLGSALDVSHHSEDPEAGLEGTTRSSVSGHRPNLPMLQNDYSSLKVLNLPLDLKLSELQDICPEAISVTKPTREVDPVTGDVVSFAFLLFSSTEDAGEALAKYQGREVRGHELSLSYRTFSVGR